MVDVGGYEGGELEELVGFGEGVTGRHCLESLSEGWISWR